MSFLVCVLLLWHCIPTFVALLLVPSAGISLTSSSVAECALTPTVRTIELITGIFVLFPIVGIYVLSRRLKFIHDAFGIKTEFDRFAKIGLASTICFLLY